MQRQSEAGSNPGFAFRNSAFGSPYIPWNPLWGSADTLSKSVIFAPFIFS